MTAASAASPARVQIAAHAKANLFLRVLSTETSGFHSIETLFTLLELADELVVERIAQGIELEVHGADTGPTEANLAYRAAALMLEATGRRFGVRIALTKKVPVQAGLGGGSSDAAAALHAVNALARYAVPRHEILQYAARLGSDVTFFASGAPFALAWGRGERLFRLAPPPAAPALLLIPPTGVSTKETYERLDAAPPHEGRRGATVLDVDALATWGGVGRLGGNDFESVIFGAHPDLKAAFERLAETGPLAVRLSGSGSALIAVYRDEPRREAAELRLAGGDYRLIRTATRAQAAPGAQAQ
ncbi:MAG: 4-(cytidine 5'-diphospho)-2-C-methyl-D-erythritol kinase [Gemmatimonadetes bacterium]|nr:4-(cytidine 5'-diphospho)-2-C-methyl-D-erythritol kinase [Gemmatimonadota bacterium]